jgi:hypothetical protein
MKHSRSASAREEGAFPAGKDAGAEGGYIIFL